MTGRELADDAWQRALAALERDAGLSIADRATQQRHTDRAALNAARRAGLARRNAQRLRRARDGQPNRQEQPMTAARDRGRRPTAT
jgi:hypothetical protein